MLLPCQELVEGLGDYFVPPVTHFYSRKTSIGGVQLGQELNASRGVGDSVKRVGCSQDSLVSSSADSVIEANFGLGGIGQVLADCDVLIGHEEACNFVCDIICAAGQLGDQCIGGSLVEEHVSV